MSISDAEFEFDSRHLELQTHCDKFCCNAHVLLELKALLTTSTDSRNIHHGIWKTQEKEPAPGIRP